MLPFLKHKQEAAVAIPVESEKRKPDHEEEYDSLHACMEELTAAVHAKDAAAAAEAFRAAFQILESEPHEEAEHAPT